MKFRKSRPSIAASIGRMIVVSIPKRPDASPEKKTDAASAHSSAVIQLLQGAEPNPIPRGVAWPPPGRLPAASLADRRGAHLATCTHPQDVRNAAQGSEVSAPTPKPDGFEGFLQLVVMSPFGHSTVAEGPDRTGARRHLDPVTTPKVARLAGDDRVLADVDELVDLAPIHSHGS